MEIAAVLVLGLIIGGILGWFFRSASTGADFALTRQRAEHAEASLAEVREQMAQLTRSRDAALAELRDESSRRATFEALAAGVPELQREIETRSLGLAQYQRTVLELSREHLTLSVLQRAGESASMNSKRLNWDHDANSAFASINQADVASFRKVAEEKIWPQYKQQYAELWDKIVNTK